MICDRNTKLQKDNKKDPEDFQANSNELIRTEIIPRDLDEVKWTKMNYYRLTLGQKGRKIRRQNDDELVSEDIEALTFLGHSLLWTVDPKVKKGSSTVLLCVARL